MNIDYLSQLPVDLFIKQITYLPFDDVISVCQTNATLHNYCTNFKYNIRWRNLIDNTFGNIYNYQNKLEQIRTKLNVSDGVYNYIVYTQLVKVLDPITQLMIYYRQKDMESFHDSQYDSTQRFLALFLLDNVKEMGKYLPSDHYLPFISMLEGHKIDQNTLDAMLVEFAEQGSLKGVSMMLSRGADIHAQNDFVLFDTSRYGHLEVVKYLIENGADVHARDDEALRYASLNGHLEVVRYLTEQGANIHADDDLALIWASLKGHLEVVKYLVEKGADIHARNDEALRMASKKDHLDVVKYLVEHGVHALDDLALRWASANGHLEVVKYLIVLMSMLGAIWLSFRSS